jgi:adenine deaminase
MVAMERTDDGSGSTARGPGASLGELLAVARGERPADLVLRGGRVVDVFTGRTEDADVAICGERIAGLGRGYRGHKTRELRGAFVSPGLIDAHVHVESAMVAPREFAAVVVPRGVTAVVADPHEIASVLGLEGVRFMLRDAEASPLAMLVAVPSCVPPTPLATSGAALGDAELARLRDEPGVVALGEMMSYPAVVAGDEAVLRKIEAFRGLPRDGHCPALRGPELCAYVAAGLDSDHEATTVAEAREKLSRGMTIFIREGTAARDLQALLPLIEPATAPRICFCTDDRTLPDLLERGSIDDVVRSAIAGGVEPLLALRIATLSPAGYFGLRDRGAIAPGRLADLVVFDDLDRPVAREVFVRGRLVARDGQSLEAPVRRGVRAAAGTVRVGWSGLSLRVPAQGGRVRIIGIVPDQLRTEALVEECRVMGGEAVADPARDLLKLAVIERHGGSGRTGLGFVRGLGLGRGALASTVAHDHHNLIVAGADDASMLAAAGAVAEVGGGLAAAEGDRVLALLPLPIAGLMSDWPAARAAARIEELTAAAHGLGSRLQDPFMTLSFLALEVIPSLKLTDRGLVDVERQQLVPLFVS